MYEAFHPFGLGGAVTRSTVFEHVGSLAELPEASRGLLTHRITPFYERDGGEIRPLEGPDRIVHNSLDVEAAVAAGASVLVEGCSSCSLGTLGGDNLVVGLEGLHLPSGLPPGFTLDGRHLPEGRVVVVLSASDSLKPEADPAPGVSAAGPSTTGWASALSRGRTSSTGERAGTSSTPASSASSPRPGSWRATSARRGPRGRGPSGTRGGSPSPRSTTGTTS